MSTGWIEVVARRAHVADVDHAPRVELALDADVPLLRARGLERIARGDEATIGRVVAGSTREPGFESCGFSTCGFVTRGGLTNAFCTKIPTSGWS